MLINTPGLTVRICPIDNAIANYDIELSHPYQVIHQGHFPSIRRPETHSRHIRTPATATTLAGESPATHPATSTEMTRAMVPHYGKPPRLPSYRDNHAPPRAMYGTPRHNTLRGPPGISRKPRGAQRDASERRGVEHRSYRRPADGTSTHGSGDGSLGSRRKRTKKRDWGDRP